MAFLLTTFTHSHHHSIDISNAESSFCVLNMIQSPFGTFSHLFSQTLADPFGPEHEFPATAIDESHEEAGDASPYPAPPPPSYLTVPIDSNTSQYRQTPTTSPFGDGTGGGATLLDSIGANNWTYSVYDDDDDDDEDSDDYGSDYDLTLYTDDDDDDDDDEENDVLEEEFDESGDFWDVNESDYDSEWQIHSDEEDEEEEEEEEDQAVGGADVDEEDEEEQRGQYGQHQQQDGEPQQQSNELVDIEMPDWDADLRGDDVF